jgi:hypothetical protein
VERRAEGEAFMGCVSNEKGDECEPEPESSFIEVNTAFACTRYHPLKCKRSASVMNRTL